MATKAGIQQLTARRPISSGASDVGGGAMPHTCLRAVDWRSMAADTAAWDALALYATEPNPFHESWYLLPALRAHGADRAVTMLRFDADGDLAGLLPVWRPRRYYRWPVPNLANWLHGNSFFGAPLVAPGLERAFWRALLAWADVNAGIGLFLHLGHMPLTGALHDALCDVLTEQARASGLVHREERALLRSDASPEDYFESALSGKKRKELRRQMARLSELGAVRLTQTDDSQDLDSWTTEFLTLEAAGWKGGAGSAMASAPPTAALFRECLVGAAARGRLQRLSLRLDDKPIAMLANFLTPPGAFSFKTAFDERYARYSPGVLLQRENLEILRRTDIAWSDSCAAADHPMIDHIWRERRPIGRISIAIGGPVRAAAFAQVLRAELGRKPAGVVAATTS